MKKYLFIVVTAAVVFLLFGNASTIFSPQNTSITINVKDVGAKGDGITNDWEVLQRAVDKLANEGGGIVYFPKGSYAIYGKSLIISGSNITLKGVHRDSVTIIKKGKVGYFGDCINIAGKINGYQYYGEFGKGDYSKRLKYDGKTEKVSNIIIENITIDTELGSNALERKVKVANGLGIINAKNITVKNCIVQNAPQTNVVILNVTDKFSNENISLDNCIFKDSGQHNVRVISYNHEKQGINIGNHVSFTNCKFLNVKGVDINQKEILKRKVLLWYRGFGKGNTSITIDNCYFDNSGMIYANKDIDGFALTNSHIGGSLNIVQNPRNLSPNITLSNCTFLKNDDKSYLLDKLEKNRVKKRKNGLKETDFGSIYPSSLIINLHR